VLALLTGALLSGTMEAIQTYLPTRVASNLDLATNALGTLIGAALIVPFTSALLDRGLLRRLRFRWFDRHGGRALSLILLWPLAQMYPQPFLFGLGDWPSRLWAMTDPSVRDTVLAFLPPLVAVPANLAAIAASPIWEGLITALGVLAGGLLASLPMRREAPRSTLILSLLAITLVIKTVVNALQTSGDPFDWLTDGASAGLLLGTVMLLLILRLPHAARASLAFSALLLSLLLVNLLPLNPYWAGVQVGWREGAYRHLNDLAQWLAAVWPYAALAWLLGSAENAILARRARREQARASSL